MGRDSSIIGERDEAENKTVKAIVNDLIDNPSKVFAGISEISLGIKEHKIFLFNKETEERINVEIKTTLADNKEN